jgi:hypothetical protein
MENKYARNCLHTVLTSDEVFFLILRKFECPIPTPLEAALSETTHVLSREAHALGVK